MSNACLTSPRLRLLRPVRSLPPLLPAQQPPQGYPLGRAGEGHTEEGEPVHPGGRPDGVCAGWGRGLPGAAGAGGSQDVRAALDQDNAAGAEGAAGERPEHPH